MFVKDLFFAVMRDTAHVHRLGDNLRDFLLCTVWREVILLSTGRFFNSLFHQPYRLLCP